MTSLRKAAQQALEALELLAKYENPLTKIQVRKPLDGGPIATVYPHKVATEAAAPLREWLALPEQEPVAWQCSECGGTHLLCPHGRKDIPLYTAPQRNPLTDEEIGKIAGDTLDPWSCARAIEKAHGIGEQT